MDLALPTAPVATACPVLTTDQEAIAAAHRLAAAYRPGAAAPAPAPRRADARVNP